MTISDAQQFQAFVKQQKVKNQEIIETVRIHHGQAVADKLASLDMLVGHETRLIALLAGTLKIVASSNIPDITEERLTAMVMSFKSAVDDSEKVMPLMWDAIFDEDEQDVLNPFMHQIANNQADIYMKLFSFRGKSKDKDED